MNLRQGKPTFSTAASACVLLLGLAELGSAHAWLLNVRPGSRRLFLHVGNGAVSKPTDIFGSSTGTSGPINTVEATLNAASVGTGLPLLMTSDSTQSASLFDGYPTCSNPSEQMMLGAGIRIDKANTTATLSVASPAYLVSAAGETIPFAEIGWTVSAYPSISRGSFAGTLQTLATVHANTYIEDCLTFSYRNSAVRAAGTYTGRVTYTLSSP